MSNTALLQRLLRRITRVLPCPCLLCGTRGPDPLCAFCVHQYFAATPFRCRRCALPVAPDLPLCGQCLSNPPAFHGTITACDYAPPVDQLVLSLKFGQQLPVAPVLAQRLALSLRQSAWPMADLPDLLTPVPLGAARLVQRGFNQALEIARPLARELCRPLDPALLRRRHDTVAQTLLAPDQRLANVRHAFTLNPALADKITGRHVGVVDDVMTTGATLQCVAQCLIRHGAARVTNLVFARTPPH